MYHGHSNNLTRGHTHILILLLLIPNNWPVTDCVVCSTLVGVVENKVHTMKLTVVVFIW